MWDAECAKAVQMEAQYEALHKGPFRDSLGRRYGGHVDLMCGIASFTGAIENTDSFHVLVLCWLALS